MQMKIEEIEIPAPWGHIAVKTWGEKSSDIVIVTHGFQDNAGSFDRLIILLPKHFYYVCVDLPGHGFSSHFHESMPIHYVNFLLAYQIVAQHFQRSNYILLGHSFGGQLSILFAQLYPERVSKLIVIDTVYTMPVDPSMFVEMIKNAHNIYFKLLEANTDGRPTYTYEEIVNKIKDNRYAGLLTYETAEDLARRMIKETDDGKYILTVDSKLKGIIFPSADINYNIEMFKVKPVNCLVLMLLMPDNMYTNLNIKLLEYFKEVGFCIKHVNDHHHVHHTNPEVVADDISKFLIIKLWGDKKNEAILVLHGVLDNAGAFDNIIPFLPENFYYICVDLPGHGKSDNFPMFLHLHIIDYIIPMKLVADYFNREKYILLGHSMGGQLAMLYAQIFPERVSKIVMLDAMYLIPFISSAFLDFFKNGLVRLDKIADQSKKPKLTYTYEEAIQKLIDGRRHGQMTRAAAEPLAKRMFDRISEDKYVMNVDTRLKDRLHPSGSIEYILELNQERPVKCPVLILLSTERNLRGLFGPLYSHYVEMGYDIHIYDGHHDMHNTHPEMIAPFVVSFLLKDKSKL